jgi:hypothetical protein
MGISTKSGQVAFQLNGATMGIRGVGPYKELSWVKDEDDIKAKLILEDTFRVDDQYLDNIVNEATIGRDRLIYEKKNARTTKKH